MLRKHVDKGMTEVTDYRVRFEWIRLMRVEISHVSKGNCNDW